MTREQIDIYEQLYRIAKEQYYNKKIEKEEYIETIFLIRKKAREIALGYNRLDFFNNPINKPTLEINIKESVNFILSMN